MRFCDAFGTGIVLEFTLDYLECRMRCRLAESVLAILAIGAPLEYAVDVTHAHASMPIGTEHLQWEDATQIDAVIEFWREAGPGLWFAKNDEFDRRFRERFSDAYARASAGRLDHWITAPNGALALVVLLDQYPRNAFRDTPRMYEADAHAREVAAAAIRMGHDRDVDLDLVLFLYLPFAHSEEISDQERSVMLNERIGEPHLSRAKHHRDIIRRFGRFPHRNAVLGRQMSPDEQQYLENGGFRG